MGFKLKRELRCFKSFKPVEIDLLSESKKIEEEGKLRLKAPRRIVLRKTVEGGSIKQNFSHGRSKSVVVEVRRKKTFVKAGDSQDGSEVMDAAHAHHLSGQKGAEDSKGLAGPDAQNRSKHQVLTPLTPDERKRLRQEQEDFRERQSAEEEAGPSVVEGDSEFRLEREAAAQAEGGASPDGDHEALDQGSVAEMTGEESAEEVTAGEETAGDGVAEASAGEGTVGEGMGKTVGDEAGMEVSVGVESSSAPATPAEVVVETMARDEKGLVRTGPALDSSEPKEAMTTDLPPVAERLSSGRDEGVKVEVEASVKVGKPVQAVAGSAKPREGQPQRVAKETAPGKPAREEMEEVVTGSARPAHPAKPGPATSASRDVHRNIDRVAVDSSEPRRVDDEVDKFGQKKKMTRAQKEDVARKKTEALVTKRLAQLDELREQKRLLEERRKIETEEGQGRKTLKTKVKRKGRKSTDPEADKALNPRKGRHGRGKGGRGGREEVFQTQAMQVGPVVRDVIIPETITVAGLASRMAVKASEVVKLLFDQGMMVTINQVLDQDTAVLVVEELGHRPKTVSEEADIVAELTEATDSDDDRIERPPVVTIMGHVDHGKTSLLDAIRKTDVASREYGGITQHIGAYQVTLKSGDAITFIDTPGHAAFTAMRSRGAKVTDVVVLVVAADDGVMPQTVEAINHAKDAKVPIIVAVNKIDKVGSNPDRVKQQLTEYELVPEEWGGQTIFANVSALNGSGVEALEELILLQAEVLGLKANPNKNARGTIVEAKLDKGRGAVATCLVQNGTLAEGDIFVVGQQWGKVRTLINDRGKVVQKAGPSMPVEIIGLSGVPEAGDELVTVQDEKRAKDIASFRQVKLKEQEHLRTAQPTQLDDLFNQIQKGELDEIKVVVKGDVRGSVEAVAESLMKIEHPEIRLNVIHTGVGGINESDVMLAMASDAVILGFNVRADAKAREMAKREKIDLRFYTVIYDLLEDMTRAMEGRLAPTKHEVFLGSASIQEVFRISKVGNVAGCVVTQGVIPAKSRIRVLRDSVVIHDGKLLALKRFKDDTREVREGQDCGISIDKFNDFKAGDVIEAFTVEEVRQTISA